MRAKSGSPPTLRFRTARDVDCFRSHTLADVVLGKRLPYYNIVPLGLLKADQESDYHLQIARHWSDLAVLLEHSINVASRRDSPGGYSVPGVLSERLRAAREQLLEVDRFISPRAINAWLSDARLTAFAQYCTDVGVCGFHQSFSAAASYLLEDGARALHECLAECGMDSYDPARILRLTLTEIRHGHTSSVLRVDADMDLSHTPLTFAVNVARDDTAAAADLIASAHRLHCLQQRDQRAVARILKVGETTLQSVVGRSLKLPIVCVEWVTNAREVHALASPNGRIGQLALVDEFMDGPHLGEVRGTLLPAALSNTLWRRMAALRLSLGDEFRAGYFASPEIEVNHGDVMAGLLDGEMFARIVACSSYDWTGPVGLIPYHFALTRATIDPTSQRYVYWGNPAAVVELLCVPELNDVACNSRRELYSRMLQDAVALELGAVRESLRVGGDEHAAQALLRSAREAFAREVSMRACQ